MRISESCAVCLYDRQKNRTDNAEYLAEIKKILDNRGENDTSPYMVYLFNKVHIRYFGKSSDYSDIKRHYNDLVLGMEDKIRREIESAEDPLAKALMMARIGNYIDFGAMDNVDEEEFLGLIGNAEMREDDEKTYKSFLRECGKAKTFLLCCDNCGEIVLDKLMIEQLKKKFPAIHVKAMVRGGQILNDATVEDAVYSGLDKVAEIISNGEPVAGTIYDMLPQDAKDALDTADVILAKGQGNYESMSGQGRHIFYEFLCKCDLFITRFEVPKLTGMFVEEKKYKALMFDLFETLLNNCSIDFNRGLKSLWERYYMDKCSFDEIVKFGEEQFDHMTALHREGKEFPFVTEELPLYAKKYGGEVVKMAAEEEADFLMKCNDMEVYPGITEMLEECSRKGIPMYVLSNSGFSAEALKVVLERLGIGRYFSGVWSSADFGRVKPCREIFEMGISEILTEHPEYKKEDILYIGDTYDTDVVGAYNAGIDAAWINRKNAADIKNYAAYEIKDTIYLREILKEKAYD